MLNKMSEGKSREIFCEEGREKKMWHHVHVRTTVVPPWIACYTGLAKSKHGIRIKRYLALALSGRGGPISSGKRLPKDSPVVPCGLAVPAWHTQMTAPSPISVKNFSIILTCKRKVLHVCRRYWPAPKAGQCCRRLTRQHRVSSVLLEAHFQS